jgi:hypothetical protein
MNAKLAFFLNDFYKHTPGASDELIASVQRKIGFELPADYLGVMREFDGGEGRVGKWGGLILYTLEEAIRSNEYMKLLMSEIPDYFLFGQDAADTGYAFHRQNKTVHGFGLMSDFSTDPIEFFGNSFTEFLEYLYER